eukprot:NODE_738_length_4687_cov_0.308849.p2 type:complete len:155 gc:universal NODE_738_length_4687_cov_0.308849:2023-1559(-)
MFSVFQRIDTKIQVSIPEEKRFFHLCVIQAARQFYQNPFIMESSAGHITCQAIQKNIELGIDIVRSAILSCVSNALPIDTLFQKREQFKLIEPAHETEIEPVPFPEPGLLPAIDAPAYLSEGKSIPEDDFEAPPGKFTIDPKYVVSIEIFNRCS